MSTIIYSGPINNTMSPARRLINALSMSESGEADSKAHPSYQRLSAAAAILLGVYGEAALSKALHSNDQQKVNNWKRRGVSRDGALEAERYIGCPATWILDGKFPRNCDWEKVCREPGATYELHAERAEIEELLNLARKLDRDSVRSLSAMLRKLTGEEK